ncbi:Kelch repeat-containing protein [Streptomyces sp. T028]|uniref:Kelch repeat-containing protein n=1 Tax=Streptomyces sp. T028 TaxID=3394379 RepID=UPI003A83F5B0
MPPIRTIPGRWRARCALTGVLAAVAVLCGMLPAGARTGLTWTILTSEPSARADAAGAAAPCPSGQTGNCLYSVGGYDGTSPLATTRSYNRTTNQWTTLSNLPTPRSGLGAAAAPCPSGLGGTCVYAVGGEQGSTILKTVQFYNPATLAWSTITQLNTARSALGVAAAPCPSGQTGTCVYAVGGTGTSGALASVESFNPATLTWTTLSSLSQARSNLGAAAAPCPSGQTGTCVYAVGGFDSSGYSDTVESYNPVSKAWSLVARLPVERSSQAVASTTCPPGQTGTCVYALGGTNITDQDTALSYNPLSNAWTTLPALPTSRYAAAAAALPCPPGATGNCVYVSGGYHNLVPVATLEALDPPVVTGR